MPGALMSGTIVGLTSVWLVAAHVNHEALHDRYVAFPNNGSQVSWAQAYGAAAALADGAAAALAANKGMGDIDCGEIDEQACIDPIVINCKAEVTAEEIEEIAQRPCPEGLDAVNRCTCLVQSKLQALKDAKDLVFKENLEYKQKILQLDGCLMDMNDFMNDVNVAIAQDFDEMNAKIDKELNAFLKETEKIADQLRSSSLNEAVNHTLVTAAHTNDLQGMPQGNALLSHKAQLESIFDVKKRDELRKVTKKNVMKRMSANSSHVLKVIAAHQEPTAVDCKKVNEDDPIGTSSLLHQSINPAGPKFLRDFKGMLRELFNESP